MALVERIAAGDAEAETALVQRFSPPVLELLTYRSGDPQLAEDLHQDTFAVVLKRLREQGIDNPEKLPAFICQTARNLLIAHRRKFSRRQTYADTETVERHSDATATAADDYQREQTAMAIAALLKELRKPRDREILHRYYVLDEPKRNICQALDLSDAHFDRVLYRARERFRTLLERKGLDRQLRSV